MVVTLIFCLCATGLCTYTVHMLLQERANTEREIYKALTEFDQVALRSPIKIKEIMTKIPVVIDEKPHNIETEKATAIQKAVNFIKNYNNGDQINVNIKEKIKRPVFNTYPIAPVKKSGVGYGFDVRI